MSSKLSKKTSLKLIVVLTILALAVLVLFSFRVLRYRSVAEIIILETPIFYAQIHHSPVGYYLDLPPPFITSRSHRVFVYPFHAREVHGGNILLNDDYAEFIFDILLNMRARPHTNIFGVRPHELLDFTEIPLILFQIWRDEASLMGDPVFKYIDIAFVGSDYIDIQVRFVDSTSRTYIIHRDDRDTFDVLHQMLMGLFAEHEENGN